MVQVRLSRLIEPLLLSRPSTSSDQTEARSTPFLFFVARWRCLILTQHKKKPLDSLFLHWKHWFHSIDHTARLLALRRCRAPRAEHTGGFGSGIRQGCPVHPCLFVILLSVIFDDVDTSLRENGAPTDVWSTQHPCFDLDYSDDTPPAFIDRVATTNRSAHTLETEASLDGCC